MEKLKNNFLKIVVLIFFILFTWITINGIFSNTVIVYHLDKIKVLICTIIYILLILFVYKAIVPHIKKHKIIKYILLALILFICIASSCYFRLDIKWENSDEYTWDMGNVFSAAEELAVKGKIEANYLLQFPNNIMLTFIYAVILKIGLLFKCTDLILLITIVNSLIVFFTILLTYLVAKHIYDENRANLFLIISIFTAPFYLYTAVFYTDTISMLFTILMCYLLVKVRESKNTKINIIYQIILGIIIGIGFKTKLTTIFIIIATMVYIIMTWNLKKILKNSFAVILTSLAVIILLNILIQQIIYKEKDATNIEAPMIHWIMIGLNENGSFTGEDYLILTSQNTHEGKVKVEKEEIKRRLSQYNAWTFMKHLNSKLVFAWGDGTYYGPIKLERQPHNKKLLHEFVLRYGKYNKYYKYIPQAMHFGMLAFILITAFSIIKENKIKNNINIIFIITMCGLMTFLLIWENRSRYVLTIVPLMCLLEVNGIDYIINKFNNWKERRI